MRLVLALCGLALMVPLAAEAHAETQADEAGAWSAQSVSLGFVDKAITDGRWSAARELLDRAKRHHPGTETDLREAEWLLATGDRPAALRQLQLLEGDEAVGLRAKTRRAIALWQDGDALSADVLLGNVVMTDPAYARAWSIRGVLADGRQAWAEAGVYYDKAIALEAGNCEYWNNRGWSRLLQGKVEAAERDFTQALKIDPDFRKARTHTILSRAMLGRYDEAMLLVDKKNLSNDLNTIGYGAILKGDMEVADGYLARSQEISRVHNPIVDANIQYLEAIKTALKRKDAK